MKFELQEITKEEVQALENRVEANSRQIDEIVDGIIQPYCKGLDEYVELVASILEESNDPPTDQELDDICMNLSTRIYFAGGLCERLGIRDDIAKAVYKESYHSNRSVLDKGTVADKDSLAELRSQHEAIISAAFTRAYKIMKSKIENAQELLQSCKKVLSRRMQELELTRMGGSGR